MARVSHEKIVGSRPPRQEHLPRDPPGPAAASRCLPRPPQGNEDHQDQPQQAAAFLKASAFTRLQLPADPRSPEPKTGSGTPGSPSKPLCSIQRTAPGDAGVPRSSPVSHTSHNPRRCHSKDLCPIHRTTPGLCNKKHKIHNEMLTPRVLPVVHI